MAAGMTCNRNREEEREGEREGEEQGTQYGSPEHTVTLCASATLEESIHPRHTHTHTHSQTHTHTYTNQHTHTCTNQNMYLTNPRVDYPSPRGVCVCVCVSRPVCRRGKRPRVLIRTGEPSRSGLKHEAQKLERKNGPSFMATCCRVPGLGCERPPTIPQTSLDVHGGTVIIITIISSSSNPPCSLFHLPLLTNGCLITLGSCTMRGCLVSVTSCGATEIIRCNLRYSYTREQHTGEGLLIDIHRGRVV